MATRVMKEYPLLESVTARLSLSMAGISTSGHVFQGQHSEDDSCFRSSMEKLEYRERYSVQVMERENPPNLST